MKRDKALLLVLGIFLFLVTNLNAQIGFYDAPYTRYEADLGTLSNGASALAKSYTQSNLQSEASDQICVNLSNTNATVQWTVSSAGDGLVVRYSVPDGSSATVDVYNGGTFLGTLTLGSYYSWEYLSSNGNPNNVGVTNTNPKMRFDEVRMKLPSSIPSGGTLKLVRTGGTVYIDFAELEAIPAAVPASGAVYGGNGSDLQTFINNNGGNTIYIPAGYYNIPSTLYFGAANTTLKGAGMWYTELHFTSGAANDGGLWGQASNISYSGLYLSTVRNSRSSSYKAINGVYTATSTITNVWAEHFECGAWIAQYGTGPAIADGFKMSYCRFRNNYADGTNLCKGTSNAIVEHCSYRNNGDDDMAIWPANNQSCDNNTFRYNTAENSWRAAGCSFYGGLSNQAHHLLIKDNLEAGLRVGNNFGGAPFSGSGQHVFSNIRIVSGGTYNDLFNSPVGAIDILVTNVAGTNVNNVKFSCIEIIDSKNDAIYMYKKSGNGFVNFVFENITIDGTGKEYPNNSAGGGNGGARGYGIMFWNSPSGNGTNCNITYANIGGNAGSNTNTGQIGSFNFTVAGSCPGGCTPLVNSTAMTSATSFGICSAPITLTASTVAPSGNTVNYVEFFVDGISIGTDNTASYSMLWSAPTSGNHSVTATAHYSPSGTTSTSPVQTVTIIPGIYSTSSAPTIDGTIESSWNGYASQNINIVSGGISAPDLDATFKTRYDATNLYILVDVTDDVVQNDAGNNWDNDGIEIFIDMGNNKGGAYGANDFQYAFVTGSATVSEYQHSATAGVTFAQGAKTGGYIMEVKIPWSTLGGAPAAGSLMGFDIGINDDDNNGVRDNQMSWNDATFSEYSNTSLFGTLQIANCANPLPVELLSFTVENGNAFNLLKWITVEEVNNKKFIIEKSANGTEWQVIGRVEGAGNSSSVVGYTYSDFELQEGVSYYRLRQVDFNGVTTYSAIVEIENAPQTIISVAPNPFEESITIKSSALENIDITIHDVLGKLVFQINKESHEGILTFQPNLASGAYIINVKIGEIIKHQKVIRK